MWKIINYSLDNLHHNITTMFHILNHMEDKFANKYSEAEIQKCNDIS